ncbi:hypothetical protein M5689_000069 [Euphorbia peplus]|nr:hypothetical protein M5689_000069 [Euphorbia peplus]
MIMAIFVFLTSILMITFIIALSALKLKLKPILKKNRVNIDLKKAETDKQKQQRCIYSDEPLMCRRTGYRPLTPKLISIGPCHCGKGVKLAMKHRKSEYLQYCLGRPSKELQQLDFEAKKIFIRDFIQKHKERICQFYEGYNSKRRSCYDKRFADNILEDSFFVIELFLRELTPSNFSNDELISCKMEENLCTGRSGFDEKSDTLFLSKGIV